MVLPTAPVQLDVPQVEELARHFSAFRHDVNGCLSLVVAAAELIRYNPDVIKRMTATLVEQPPRIAGKTREFIGECERVLGVRDAAEPSWYRDMWKRHNAGPGDPSGPVTVSPEMAKQAHSELLQFGKELAQMAFIVSGANVLSNADPAGADDVTLTASEQLSKVTRKFDQLADTIEKALSISATAPRRLASGAPSGPVILPPDHVALFHRHLTNLERDLTEHLKPLLELSRLARKSPREVQARAPEFAQQPPRITAELNQFAVEFDRTFAIVRGGAS